MKIFQCKKVKFNLASAIELSETADVVYNFKKPYASDQLRWHIWPTFPSNCFMRFSQDDSLPLFYTMLQKVKNDQKTQIKGGVLCMFGRRGDFFQLEPSRQRQESCCTKKRFALSGASSVSKKILTWRTSVGPGTVQSLHLYVEIFLITDEAPERVKHFSLQQLSYLCLNTISLVEITPLLSWPLTTSGQDQKPWYGHHLSNLPSVTYWSMPASIPGPHRHRIYDRRKEASSRGW